MTTASAFRLETVPPAALVVGPDSWLCGRLADWLASRSFSVYFTPDSLPPDTQLDLIASFGSLPPKLLASLSPSALSPSCQSYLFLPLSALADSSASRRFDPLPNPNFVFHAEIIGPHLSAAPTLDHLLTQAVGQGALTLPGDGLFDYPLLTEADFLSGLAAALSQSNSSASRRTHSLVLATGTLSLHSLAYLIRSQLNTPLKLSFDPQANWQSGLTDPSLLQSTKDYLNWQPKSDLHSELFSYLKNYLARPPAAPAQPPQPAPAQKLPQPTVPPTEPNPPRLTRLSDLVGRVAKRKSPPSPPPIAFVPISKSSLRSRLGRLLPRFKLGFRPFSRPPRSRSAPRPQAIILTGLILGLGLYLLAFIAALTATLLAINSHQRLLSSSTLPPARSLHAARPLALFLEANLVAVGSLPVLGGLQPVQQAVTLAGNYRQALDSLLLASDLSSTGSALVAHLFGQAESDLASLLSLAKLQTGELYERLSLLEGSLPADPPSLLPASLAAEWQSLHRSLKTLREHTLTARLLLSIAPDFLGVGDRRKYLVLFQNNMELRATGGFIGSFALLSFENGELYDFPIYDVYAADGQLKGHVEPPAPLKTHLGEANWYLRDSNWDPDFVTSARRAEWFLNKTLGTSVDGTIAINVNTLAELLKATGPLTLSDYDEQVSEANIFERAEYHSEVNFFPGSTQKKEFLSSVADALQEQLSNLTKDSVLPVTRALLTSLDQKDTLIALSGTSTNQVLSSLGWNGELRPPSCPQLVGGQKDQSCYLDHLFLVDSNVGVNKANYFLRRSHSLVIKVDKDRRLSHTLTVTYHNTSESSSWPAGAYKNYSRLYLPPSTVLGSVSINDQPLSETDYTLTAEHGRTVLGFLVEVPIRSQAVVQVNYQSAGRLSEQNPLYTLYWQKQPGTAADPLNITLQYPLYLKPKIVSPEARVGEQSLEFNLSNITDRRITVQFE